jgi:hypothetical protein
MFKYTNQYIPVKNILGQVRLCVCVWYYCFWAEVQLCLMPVRYCCYFVLHCVWLDLFVNVTSDLL